MNENKVCQDNLLEGNDKAMKLNDTSMISSAT